jgi:YebC/PmpR family DNA-binding regulatory protein
MAGHSKWHNIKQKKGTEDQKRAAVFTKLSRGIVSSVKEGGSSDPSSNASLRVSIDKARSQNMPKENIEKALARGSVLLGQNRVEGCGFFEVQYEAYGPGGVGMVIKVITDNKNRISSNIKNILSKYKGSLGEPGCAAYIFSNGKPSFNVPIEDRNKFANLIGELEEIDDIVEVIHNGQF